MLRRAMGMCKVPKEERLQMVAPFLTLPSELQIEGQVKVKAPKEEKIPQTKKDDDDNGS